jgi:hypothetical protein
MDKELFYIRAFNDYPQINRMVNNLIGHGGGIHNLSIQRDIRSALEIYLFNKKKSK